MNYIEFIVIFIGIITSSLSIASVIAYQKHKKNILSDYIVTTNNKLISIDCSLLKYSRYTSNFDGDEFDVVLTESELSIINSLHANRSQSIS